ncbi:MAG TPA: hypothetical protein P5056_02750 [Candidatus Paceibacterota bacterium]|nr:hypothetical protein [Candidatus Paceibacterota bacterium]
MAESNLRDELDRVFRDMETAKRIIANCEWRRRDIFEKLQKECAHKGIIFYCPTRSSSYVPLLMCADCGFGGGEADSVEWVKELLSPVGATLVTEQGMLEACNAIFGEDYIDPTIIHYVEGIEDTGIW